ncbi:MAG: dipeptide/oligopeptide/nickel ABC transporter ATP-binding protein [Rhodobacteraceae bacterium]|jgi:ABC-type glutathione transport system ATPase component|nr:dipeptide/oligopeptide/nickel ABC transporter ATP-binding protein [Paracoccaceae bacterium]
MTALVEVGGLHFRYGSSRRGTGQDWTLADISLALPARGTLGIVGESGSGKSTLIRLMCGLLRPDRGALSFDGRPVTDWLATDRRAFLARNQIVFQNPRRSLDPRMTVARALAEPVRSLESRQPTDAELAASLARVGLQAEVLGRYPHQLSGGQLQRVAIARALSVRPAVLYADEPTSALDVSVQAQVLNLLMDLREDLGLALVMVTHNLAVVARLTEHVIVLHRGRVVEAGPTHRVLGSPENPYTAALVAAAADVSLARAGWDEAEERR